jgi:hypothetical protein
MPAGEDSGLMLPDLYPNPRQAAMPFIPIMPDTPLDEDFMALR